VLGEPVDGMARLQLARALVGSGDAAKAKGVYNDLFSLWKHADPRVPTIENARAEYAKLQ
jgi:eukaryotic-like serine/threonine-protein kinase